ncbi:MAG TPA: radical SAM protein [Dehalococcoidales bacterium]|nr:radical SAM protein [Dehalococcoidales bacterium]
MKILLTNSPLHFSHGHTFTQPDWQTLVLPLLAAIIGNKHEIRLVDNMTLLFRSNVILERIKDFHPDVVGFSIIAARDLYNTIDVIRQVRAGYPHVTLLAGGQGGSFFDELLLQSGIDYVVRGEGEVTLRELISAIDEGEADLAGIPGLSFKRADGIYRTAERPKIKDLDDSPFPAIDLMPPRKSRWFPRRLTGSIETSRGCPYDCNFCAITAFWDRSFREKSNERIIEEMKLLSRRGRTHLYLADDNFGMNVKKHVDLFERILREGLDVRFFAQMRTDTIALHPEMVALAARAGLYGALIGFDTYEPDTFHHVTKVGSVELNLKCAELMRKNKIMIFGSHIYALPSQKKPLDFARTFWTGRQNSDLFRMPHFSMLPGTKAYGKMITQEALDSKKGDDDFRLFIRPAKEQARFRRWYTIFNFLNILLPDEILKALFHPNPSVRKIKQRGYIGIGRHYLYKVLGRFGLCDV